METSEAEVKHWEHVHSTYRLHLETLSLIMHPWRLCDSTRQSAAEVERLLHAAIDAMEALPTTHEVAVKKKGLDKVRKQLAGLSTLVDWWWHNVWQAMQQGTLTPMWTRWVAELLLPLLYGQRQVARTRCPRRKAKIVQTLQAVKVAFETHPLTQQLAPDVLAGWHAWAAEPAKAFQQASSAVEGRNSYLSQRQHNHRGLPKQRYKGWTVLHNFDCRATDGTTPASRFFQRGFPNLFETVLSKMDDMPRPRQRRQALAISS